MLAAGMAAAGEALDVTPCARSRLSPHIAKKVSAQWQPSQQQRCRSPALLGLGPWGALFRCDEE